MAVARTSPRHRPVGPPLHQVGLLALSHCRVHICACCHVGCASTWSRISGVMTSVCDTTPLRCSHSFPAALALPAPASCLLHAPCLCVDVPFLYVASVSFFFFFYFFFLTICLSFLHPHIPLWSPSHPSVLLTLVSRCSCPSCPCLLPAAYSLPLH